MEAGKELERRVIPNLAANFPIISLSDVFIVAPIVSNILLITGQINLAYYATLTKLSSFALYNLFSLIDNIQKLRTKEMHFETKNLDSMPEEYRRSEASVLIEMVNDEYVPQNYERNDLAQIVNQELTRFIAGYTGQRVETSHKIRSWTITKSLFPHAAGACDPFSGEVYIFRNMGVFEPHVIGHEFAHRKGYFKELDAQLLAYYALISSDDPVLIQSAHCERLNSHMIVLSDWNWEKKSEYVKNSDLRPELKKDFIGRRPKLNLYERIVSSAMISIYKVKLRLTKQRLEDYDQGFTDALYTFWKRAKKSSSA